ncbi:hypothetical protein T484DRAFT_1954836 [Baffinella frigidus]|nr:hypothetical protein T484DRAFT_1954836 [Cryptophyta sp. CCMP2293]
MPCRTRSSIRTRTAWHTLLQSWGGILPGAAAAAGGGMGGTRAGVGNAVRCRVTQTPEETEEQVRIVTLGGGGGRRISWRGFTDTSSAAGCSSARATLATASTTTPTGDISACRGGRCSTSGGVGLLSINRMVRGGAPSARLVR